MTFDRNPRTYDHIDEDEGNNNSRNDVLSAEGEITDSLIDDEAGHSTHSRQHKLKSKKKSMITKWFHLMDHQTSVEEISSVEENDQAGRKSPPAPLKSLEKRSNTSKMIKKIFHLDETQAEHENSPVTSTENVNTPSSDAQDKDGKKCTGGNEHESLIYRIFHKPASETKSNSQDSPTSPSSPLLPYILPLNDKISLQKEAIQDEHPNYAPGQATRNSRNRAFSSQGGASESPSKRAESSPHHKSASVGKYDSNNLSEKYGKLKEILGRGANSVVHMVHPHGDKNKCLAVKEFRKRRSNETEKEYEKKVFAEFCISSSLKHVNVVETVDLVMDDV